MREGDGLEKGERKSRKKEEGRHEHSQKSEGGATKMEMHNHGQEKTGGG